MKKSYLLFLLSIVFVSCDNTQENCRNNTFGPSTWQQDSGYQPMWPQCRFDQDDTVRVDVPPLDWYNQSAGHYTFNEGCGTFDFIPTGSTTTKHYIIEKNDGNVIWLRLDGELYYFHRQ